MNTEKLANLIATGVREEDILDIMGCSLAEYQEALASGETKQQIQQAKTERHEQFTDINSGWDAIEQHGIATVLQTLMQNPDPSFALAAATQANKMRRRDAGTGQIQPIHAQQNNVVVVQLNKDFTERLDGNFGAERTVSSAGMPKDVNAMPLQDAEKALLAVDTAEAHSSLEDLLEDIKQPVTMDVRQ